MPAHISTACPADHRRSAARSIACSATPPAVAELAAALGAGLARAARIGRLDRDPRPASRRAAPTPPRPRARGQGPAAGPFACSRWPRAGTNEGPSRQADGRHPEEHLAGDGHGDWFVVQPQIQGPVQAQNSLRCWVADRVAIGPGRGGDRPGPRLRRSRCGRPGLHRPGAENQCLSCRPRSPLQPPLLLEATLEQSVNGNGCEDDGAIDEVRVVVGQSHGHDPCLDGTDHERAN
jgi:hypothetical protein